jgi:hypothetical protein
MPTRQSYRLEQPCRLLLLGLLLCCGTANPGWASDGPPQWVFDIELSPLAESEGAYRCKAKVLEAGSEEVLAGPSVTFLRGEPATTKSALPGDRGSVALSVEVDEAAPRVTYQLEIYSLDGSLVAAHRGSILLER